MDITDYQDTARQDFDPRPKASQAVAAAKRARAVLEEDDAPAPSGGLNAKQQRMLLIVSGSLVVLALVAALSYQLATTGGPRALPTSAALPLQSLQEQPAAEPPAAVPEEDQRVVMVNVYGAPNGSVIGPIERTRQIQPVAHYGPAWVQAQVEGSGLVWIRLADLPDLAIVGPDLQPRAAEDAPAVEAQTWSAPQPQEQPVVSSVEVVPVEKQAPGGREGGGSSDWCRGSRADDPVCNKPVAKAQP